MTSTKTLSREQTTMRVSLVSICGNLFLCFFKFFAGILGHSGALISDAVHSAADAIDTIIVIIGIKMASKAPDARHPYGHERMECVAAIILSIILGIIGAGIGIAGAETILSGQYKEAALPTQLALFAALISIAVKEGLYWYMRGSARKISSDSLMAIAWHNRADALSSIGSFIGILGARCGLPVLDPLISIIICLFVINAAVSIFKGAIDKMIDRSCKEEISRAIFAAADAFDPFCSVAQMRTRQFGNKIYVDIYLAFSENPALEKADRMCRQLQNYIEENFEDVKECMVIPTMA